MTKPTMTREEIAALVEQTREEFAGEELAGAVWEAQMKAGRPALGERTGASPQVTFRLTNAMKRAAATRAESEGKTISQLAREAFEHYLTV